MGQCMYPSKQAERFDISGQGFLEVITKTLTLLFVELASSNQVSDGGP